MKQPSRGRVPKKHVILFLAANPLDTDRVALDREARAIQLELRRSGYRDRFEFVTWWAAEPLDLLRALRERLPTIVHFSGHGAHTGSGRGSGRDLAIDSAPEQSAPGGVAFVAADGRGQVVTPAAFGQTLAAAGAQVRVVVLNACFTGPMAQALAAHVDCVVGMTGSIHDAAARIFSIGFYGGLGEHASVAAAFAHGTSAINLEGLADVDQPQLLVRDGFDAAGLVLAAAEPSAIVDLPCPYPGMRPFSADDKNQFHGREREITELVGRLRVGEREIFVIGPSGSGKSSLVTAGVLPRLARGVAGLGPCVVRELRPGEQPAERLSEALEVRDGEPLVVADRVAALLAHHAAGALLLVVVDQLEELFTLASVAERAAFLAALRALRAEPRCAVVFTLRADFFGALMESDLWAERHGRLSRIEVSPLRDEALAEAIAEPARAVGVTVEPELIVRLVADAASEPGILPLLQETMVQLWDARSDQTLTLADYQALGEGERSGLSVALARRAEATLRRFDAAQTAIARRILLRLISFGEGRSDTRRQQSHAQLRSAGDDAVAFAFVLQAMVEDRLLTVDDDVAGAPRVDLSHEAMITGWPELRLWVDERRADEQRRRRLEVKAAEWVNSGRGQSRLLDADELRELHNWLSDEKAHDLGISAEIQSLLATSEVALTAQIAEAEGRRVRALRWTRVAISALVGLVVAIVSGALVLRNETRLRSRGNFLQSHDRRLNIYMDRVGRDMTGMLELLASNHELRRAMSKAHDATPAAAAAMTASTEAAIHLARQMYDVLSSKNGLTPDVFALFTPANELRFAAPPKVIDEWVLAKLAAVEKARNGKVFAHRQLSDGVPYQMSAMPIRGDNEQIVGGMLMGVNLQRLFVEFAEQSDDRVAMQVRPTLITGETILASAWPADRWAELVLAMRPEEGVRLSIGDDSRDVIRLRDGDFDFYSDDLFEGYNERDAGTVGRLVITRSRANVIDPASKLPLLELLLIIGASITVTMLVAILVTRRIR